MIREWKNLSRGVFLVNCLAIVYDKQKLLIGRRVNDPYLKNLTWGFPGGRPAYNMSLECSLKREIERKTGLLTRVLGLYHARLFPSEPRFLLLYYLAVPIGGTLRPGEKFVEVKWIAPKSAKDYFTTPIDNRIMRLLKTIEEKPGRNIRELFQSRRL